MPNNDKTIYVYADGIEVVPALMGRLYSNNSRGREIFSFEYDDGWLSRADVCPFLDPDIHLCEGRQYLPTDKAIFGVFSDSCPDRFGRKLMNRREVILANKEARKPRALTESDYLLGVYDDARMGALRFSLKENGDFLSNDKEIATPPWTTLRTLENASIALERDNKDRADLWLKVLLAPGSSLGGARPKASVMSPDGSLWIAKFPSKNDEWDYGAWEMVAHDLASMCGLNVPEAKLEHFSDNGSTFLVKRFDRSGTHRIHYSSAMTLLGKTDGDYSVGYLDLVSFIKANGNAPKNNLNELFKRIVFSVAISNTDDHLRNHGFLFDKNGWQLSPMFDVNPNVYGNNLSLNISEYDNTMSFSLVEETAPYYELSIEQTKSIVFDICKTVAENWRSVAEKYGLGRSAIMDMASAFQNAEEFLKSMQSREISSKGFHKKNFERER